MSRPKRVRPGRNHAINHMMVECRRMRQEAPVTTHERIEINPEIMGGKPVIRGTRVPVEIVLRKLGAGMTPEAIMADHPRRRTFARRKPSPQTIWPMKL